MAPIAMAACILLSIVILSTSKSTQYASSLRSWLALRCVAVEQGGDLLNESVLHLIHNSLLEGTHLVFHLSSNSLLEGTHLVF